MRCLIAIAPLTFCMEVSGQNLPYDAHQACKKDEDTRQIISGGAGAAIGAFAGSKIVSEDNKIKGAIIGGTVGGVLGVGIADKTIDCDPVYFENTLYAKEVYQTTHGRSAVIQAAPQSNYPERIVYSDHPVYSNPGYSGSERGQSSFESSSGSYQEPQLIRQRAYMQPSGASLDSAYVEPKILHSDRRTDISAPIYYLGSVPSQTHRHGSRVCNEAHP